MKRFPPNFLCHEREDPDTWAHRDVEVTALLLGGWSRVTVVTVIGWGWGGLPEEGKERVSGYWNVVKHAGRLP